MKHDAIAPHTINKQPVRIDVALEKAGVLAPEAMLTKRVG